MSYKSPPTKLPPCLPDDVLHDEILWQPTWEENQLAWHLKKLALLRAELQRDWIAEQHQKLARIAEEIDHEQRRIDLADHYEKQEAWWRSQAEQTDDVGAEMKRLQTELDAATYNRLLERTEKAGRAIVKQNAEIERAELKRRGIYRGR
jgi:hypothetical protein